MPLGDVALYYRQQKELRTQPIEESRVEQATEANAPPTPVPAATPLPPSTVAPRASSVAETAASERQAVADKRSTPPESQPPSRSVRVIRGDTLWKIASRHLGDGKEWRRIAALNPQIADPNRIREGERLLLPDVPVAVAGSPAHPIRVQPGDSLWKLAKAQWGHGEAWSCIVASNPAIKETTRILPGQILLLPHTCAGLT
jgi:nucleoid-associated protein YgaU